MKFLRLYILTILCCFAFSGLAHAQIDATSLPSFSLHKHQSEAEGKTLLVIGGIQGDEPGGFHAASLLITHYQIESGNVWIVPNLNFPSIIKRSRGVYGDLNRKFAAISEGDPEYLLVDRIKSIILDKQVDMILNLHDGSGYYRTKYLDKMHNPHRWGQSVIIDQEDIKASHYGNLGDFSRSVVEEVNEKITDSEKRYTVKNTKTREGNVEMAKTLTFFAINNGKAAFGVEASKSLTKPKRVYYHLQVLESFMDKMGIEYSRNFDLDVASVEQIIEENRQIAFYDKRIHLEMSNVRKQLNYFPLDEAGMINFSTMDPLVTVIPQSSHYDVYQGNERVTTLVPQYFRYDKQLPTLNVIVDSDLRNVTVGKTLTVRKSFQVQPLAGYRINAIGFSAKTKDEAGISLSKKDFGKRFSLDKAGNVYRLEIYRLAADKKEKDMFAGMLLVKFCDSEVQTVALSD